LIFPTNSKEKKILDFFRFQAFVPTLSIFFWQTYQRELFDPVIFLTKKSTSKKKHEKFFVRILLRIF